MNRLLFLFALTIISNLIFAQTTTPSPKKVLDHQVYESWKNISNQLVSDDGKWVSYEIWPEKGDGYLYLYNTEKSQLDSVARGTNASFSAAADFLVFQIKVQYDTLRQLKLKKTPKSKLPNDSLGIWFFEHDSIAKIADVKNYEIAYKNAAWIAYEDLGKRSKATPVVKKKQWKLFKKTSTAVKPEIPQKGDNMVLYHPISNTKTHFDKVDDYGFNYDGNVFYALYNNKIDSGEQVEIVVLNLITSEQKSILQHQGIAAKPTISRDGSKIAFLLAQDSSKTDKIYDLFLWKSSDSIASLIVDTLSTGMIKGWSPSINRGLSFSKDGSKLYFGTAPNPIKEAEDTLLAEEKYHVDVWNYQDGHLQSQQKAEIRRTLRQTYLAQWDLDNNSFLQLADTTLETVYPVGDGQSHFAMGIDGTKYEFDQTFDGWYSDYYVVNIHDASRELVLERQGSRVEMSPNGHYLIYYNVDKQAWFSYDIEGRQHLNLTSELGVNFFDESHDMPNDASPYGTEGWYSDDKYVVIKDRYDLWRIDPRMKTKPMNLTKGYGRENSIRFSEIVFDRDENEYFNDENPHYLRAFNDMDKSGGYYLMSLDGNEVPQSLINSDHSYYHPLKAKNADMVIFRRSSFTEYPNTMLTTTKFANPKQISDANPQQSEYLWGTVEPMKWTAYDGQKLSGLLYKPENFDSTKQYPMIVYFYERYSDNIHAHYIPKPSHSTINFAEYVSNGYIVFVPDITYEIGHPAKSAYNSIVSGTEFLKKNSWIDGKHIGIQGQSWGGYQVAMLVTMTDIYACGEAGAPVSNMVSAYGGIRWESGMNRAFQYEKTQSRIGVPLWDSLELYIENSPIFFAPKVNTPLLIMSNDDDGAVPWYQGIEYFTALRRLEKPVWMLTYNKDGHNLMKWPNRVDLSIRMLQFFNHYLKEEPMPVWMSQGIPAAKKGKMDGYDLENKQ